MTKTIPYDDEDRAIIHYMAMRWMVRNKKTGTCSMISSIRPSQKRKPIYLAGGYAISYNELHINYEWFSGGDVCGKIKE